jgi:carbonic anhydrase
MSGVIEGCLRSWQEEFPKRSALFNGLPCSQAPQVLFIACSDSRVVPEF